MTPLYTPDEFTQAKSLDLLPLQCKVCGITFYQRKHYIRKAMGPKPPGSMAFCSKSCASVAQTTSLAVQCLQCATTFRKGKREVARRRNHFCSNSCAATYNNQHKTQGTRRSKLEAWLEDQLVSRHPELEFQFNRTDAIDAELDIYLPKLKLAFELNGIFHYEPIYGADKLDRIHANDHRKLLACAERGIELCVIDNSSMKVFKPLRAQKFLDIIEGVLARAVLMR